MSRKEWDFNGLEDVDGSWRTSEKDVMDIIESYFDNIFFTSKPYASNIGAITHFVEPVIMEEMSSVLEVDFTDMEVKKAPFEMGSNKALRSDGFHAGLP